MGYWIRYGTGSGDKYMDTEDLDLAKNEADEGTSYTQTSVIITDDDDNEITTRLWCGCRTGFEDYDDPIDCGDFGYYTDWSD